MTGYWWSERIGPGYNHQYEVEPLYEERSPYQSIKLFYNPLWGRFLVLDGIVQLTEEDEYVYHEMMAHLPICGMEGGVESVLIIGGGDTGLLREVQRWDFIKRIVQVELDRAVIEACRKYLPEICGDLDDPRVELIIGDGAAYVKEARGRGERFDLILLDSTDPIGPAVVLFERPFHEDLWALLPEKGVVVRQSGLPRTMPKVMPFVVRRLEEVFSRVAIFRAPVPTYGDEMAFVMAYKGEVDCSEPRLEYRGRFYSPGAHRGAFAIPRWWEELISSYQDDGQVPVDFLY